MVAAPRCVDDDDDDDGTWRVDCACAWEDRGGSGCEEEDGERRVAAVAAAVPNKALVRRSTVSSKSAIPSNPLVTFRKILCNPALVVAVDIGGG